jgi:hypothetical protein
MSVSRKVIFCFCLVLLTGNSVLAQGTKSPYTTFGIGESYGTSLVHNQGMGGLGLSRPQFWYINNQNPALLAYNSFTVFSVGMLGEQRELLTATDSEKEQGGNLNYLAIAFPVKYGKVTTSIGLMPYTNVNYKLRYFELIENSQDSAIFVESGNSGLTQLYWSTGFKIHKDIALGVKASYLFGSINNVFEGALKTNQAQVPFISGFTENTYAKGFMLGGGLSYSMDSLFNKNYRFSFGAVYDLKSRVPANLETERYKLSGLTGDSLSVEPVERNPGKLQLPSSFGAGISFGQDRKWTIGVDYYQQDWATFRALNQEDENGLGKSWKWVAGAEITPDYMSLSYLKRVTYRVGASYEQLPFSTNGKAVNDSGLTFGLSLPTGRSSIDLAVKTGSRGTLADNGLKEKYVKVFLGVTLNDTWFVKRKFD